MLEVEEIKLDSNSLILCLSGGRKVLLEITENSRKIREGDKVFMWPNWRMGFDSEKEVQIFISRGEIRVFEGEIDWKMRRCVHEDGFAHCCFCRGPIYASPPHSNPTVVIEEGSG